MGLIYAGMESGIVAATDRDDVWSGVAAGLGTGAIYRAARGGALGGLATVAVVAGNEKNSAIVVPPLNLSQTSIVIDN
ncbi:Mitochondrial inner membrane translocase subunit Tim17/Tim22/Tim23/peroxisomal protein PMP24 [Corchorus olitorius]|uniref:Mitochondrial inner membrane translocase subunit Tim17/Tim22/Tim23/peroxisomal protein PMP24 n=1 Tax=Corchorus olitorius TaxID=93759 RepID=A0A1R3IND5_9ROSI|nr:Mitochondrial inner membrane translocase subunit Tim17/Tim22/Tim23/peroxisomal protein PMP24 [Corchorus olitorius]